MKNRFSWVLGVLGFCLVSSSQGVAGQKIFNLADEAASGAERQKLEQFLEQVVDSLPSQMAQLIEAPITLKFFPSKGPLPDPCDPKLANYLFANYSNFTNEIGLNDLLKAEILRGAPAAESQFNCGHHNFYRLAQSALVHEVTHAFDHRVKDQTGRALSKDKQFENLTGWYKNSLIFHWRTQGNFEHSRSPDPEEFKNSAETLAVNMEYFILDPDFQCRRPSIYTFLSKRLNHTPFPGYVCHTNFSVLLQNVGDPEGSKTRVHQTDINPDRIYQIHYLLATKGDSFSSLWGHSMLRLVMCKPGRPLGPKCLTHDAAYHVVVSYRANVEDLITDSLKGLRGDYPSQSFFYTLNEISNEYTKDQLRDLVSLPLQLSDEQKRLFGYRMLEQYWGYRGKYYFLNNNCAVEALNSVKAVFPASSPVKVQNSYSITPVGVMEELLKDGALSMDGLLNESGDTFPIVDRSGQVLSPDLAESRGYYFRAKTDQLDRNFAVLKNQWEFLYFKDRNSYLNKTTADERLGLFRHLMEQPDISVADKVTLTFSFDILELQIRRMTGKALRDRVSLSLLRDSGELRQKAGQFLEVQKSLAPWNTLPAGTYGVPLVEDFNASRPGVELSVARYGDLALQIKGWARDLFHDLFDELDRAARNSREFVEFVGSHGG